MTCSCIIHDATRRDPTGTTKIAVRWKRDVRGRWTKIKGLIRRAVVDLDVFGIRSTTKDSDIVHGVLSRMFDSNIVVTDAIKRPGRFEFKHSATKTNAFMGWLRQEMDAAVLEVKSGTTRRVSAQESWQNTYIDSAYQKGIRDARGRTQQPIGSGSIRAAFNQPIHADAVGLIYTRTYDELAGVTRATANTISEELARGLAEGRHPLEIAGDLSDRVDAVGITRSELIARTETTAAHAEATLNEYREAEIEGVSVEAEFTATDDDKVCPDCEEMSGKVYTLEEASGIIPVHPNCRCAFIPVVEQ